MKETITRTTTNYDLNIWDRRGYETEYAEEYGPRRQRIFQD